MGLSVGKQSGNNSEKFPIGYIVFLHALELEKGWSEQFEDKHSKEGG